MTIGLKVRVQQLNNQKWITQHIGYVQSFTPKFARVILQLEESRESRLFIRNSPHKRVIPL